MNSLKFPDFSSTPVPEMEYLKVPPQIMRLKRPVSPEQVFVNKIRSTAVPLKVLLVNFVHFVKSAQNETLSTERLMKFCTDLSSIFKTQQIDQIRTIGIELNSTTIKLLGDSFNDLSIFLGEYRKQKDGETISFVDLLLVDIDLEELTDHVETYFNNSLTFLNRGRSKDVKALSKRASKEKLFRITLTSPSGETRLLIGPPAKIVPSVADAALLLSINDST